MAKSKQLMELIDLGKKIVSEFSGEGGNNSTADWMGHYLAELILKAEHEQSPVKKATYQKECAELIERLWQMRVHFPDRTAPLSKFKHVLSVLAALKNEEHNPLQFFREPEDGNLFGEYIRSMRRSMQEIFRICLNDTFSPEEAHDEAEWMTLTPHLKSDEREVLAELYATLDLFSTEDATKNKKVKPIQANNITTHPINKIIEKLEQQHEQQKKCLETLKKKINS